MRSKTTGLSLVAIALLALAMPAHAAWNAQLRIFVPAQGQVVLYDSASCRGEPYVVLQVGRNYNDFTTLSSGSGGSWNDRASCVDVGPNTRLTIYQHTNYGGSSKTFSSGPYGFCGDWWDNSISSAKVQ